MTFDPDTLTINVLDTVFFTGLGYHDVTEVNESHIYQMEQHLTEALPIYLMIFMSSQSQEPITMYVLHMLVWE